jgi:hypothetical protein
MASQEQVIKPIDPEVLPPSHLPTLREDLATIEKFFNDLTPIFEEVRRLNQAGGIKNPETRIRAGVLNAEWKRICGEAEETMKPHKKVVNDFKEKYVLTPERKVNNRGEEIKALLGNMMAKWDRDEQAAKDAEQRRQQLEEKQRLDRIAEEKRQADEAQAKELRAKRVAEIRQDLKDKKITKRQAEKQLREAGAMEEALKAQAAAEEEEAKEKATETAKTVKVQSNIPTLAGNVKRITYLAKCSNPRGFIMSMMQAFAKKDIATFERLLKMVEVSNDKLTDEAKAQIKTHSDDDRHDLTAAEFLALYPFVELEEKRSY